MHKCPRCKDDAPQASLRSTIKALQYYDVLKYSGLKFYEIGPDGSRWYICMDCGWLGNPLSGRSNREVGVE